MSLENRAWSAEEKARITSVLEEGANILTDIEALRDGLKDTVSSIAEDYEIPKRVLNKAIRSYHKHSIAEDREQVSSVEEILTVAGKL
jgi:transposase-like protein